MIRDHIYYSKLHRFGILFCERLMFLHSSLSICVIVQSIIYVANPAYSADEGLLGNVTCRLRSFVSARFAAKAVRRPQMLQAFFAFRKWKIQLSWQGL